ncbi:MAG: chemotaxis protein CheW, partial [Rhodobacterales bacterium]|nr:chemotaxis protein CheW [Rhodobacterales bacterium]
ISFAVESRLVREVLRTPPLTALPKTGSLLEGVGNVHGAAVPVFDIRPLLGLDAATPMARTQLLLLGDGRESLGVLVDSADQLRAIPAGRIRAAEGHGAAEGILRGVTPDGLTVVDGDRLMAADRLWQQPPATPGNPLPVPSETRN